MARCRLAKGGTTSSLLERSLADGWKFGLCHVPIQQQLREDIVCRHRCFGRLVIFGGPGNKGYVTAFTKKYGIEVSAYHPAANNGGEVFIALANRSAGSLPISLTPRIHVEGAATATRSVAI